MTQRARKILILCFILMLLPALGVVSLFSWVLVQGPRMKTQPHLRTFEAVMPLPPQGSLPVEYGQAEREAGLVADTEAIRRRGEIYYQYYCLFCHGEAGSGNGPVGGSYMPVPADLRTAKIQNYPAERLRRAMLSGVGHEPVLERVVPVEHRGYLVVYVRSLGRGR